MEEQIMQQLLLNYLANRAQTDNSLLHARQFFISQWYEDNQDTNATEFYSLLWNEKLEASVTTLPRDKLVQIIRSFASKRNFMKSFDQYLKHLVAVLGDAHAILRSKALKSLAAIIASDPDILKNVVPFTSITYLYVGHCPKCRKKQIYGSINFCARSCCGSCWQIYTHKT
jgi:hypothetical protein